MNELQMYSAYHEVKQQQDWRDLKVAVERISNWPGPHGRRVSHSNPYGLWDKSLGVVNGKLCTLYKAGDWVIIEGKPPELNLLQKYLLKLFGVRV